MKPYTAKTIFSGYNIGQRSGDNYVAVPHHLRGSVLPVKHNGSVMMVYGDDKPVITKTFPHKDGRSGVYQMDYFKWEPVNDLFSTL